MLWLITHGINDYKSCSNTAYQSRVRPIQFCKSDTIEQSVFLLFRFVTEDSSVLDKQVSLDVFGIIVEDIATPHVTVIDAAFRDAYMNKITWNM